MKTPLPVRIACLWTGLLIPGANNPVLNLYTNEGLPATPFRTDR